MHQTKTKIRTKYVKKFGHVLSFTEEILQTRTEWRASKITVAVKHVKVDKQGK